MKSTFCSIAAFVFLGLATLVASADASGLAALAEAAKKAGEDRLASNLRDLDATVTAKMIEDSAGAQKCLARSGGGKLSSSDAKNRDQILSKIESKVLAKFLPGLVAFLGSNTAGAIAIVLNPEQIGKDAIEVTGNPGGNTVDELVEASRMLLRGSLPESFARFSDDRKATLLACALTG